MAHFTIKCYAAILPVGTSEVYRLGYDTPVGSVIINEKQEIDVGKESVIIFDTGCAAIQAIGTLTENGEDLRYKMVPATTQAPP